MVAPLQFFFSFFSKKFKVHYLLYRYIIVKYFRHGVFPNISMYFNVFRSISMYFEVFQCILKYFQIFQCILKYFNVFQCISPVIKKNFRRSSCTLAIFFFIFLTNFISILLTIQIHKCEILEAQCISKYFNVFPNISMYSEVFPNISMYFQVF